MSFSVTSIRNWILKDPLLDYLHYYGDPSEKDSFPIPESNFTEYIMNKGNQYEKLIYEHIKSHSGDLTFEIIERGNFYMQTKDAFKRRVDIICQPFIKDYSSLIFRDKKIYGFPDILIKKKALKKIFNYTVPLIGNLDDYVVIDIKYSRCNHKEGVFHADSNYSKFIECQIMLYGLMVNSLFKQHTNVGFVCPKQSVTKDAKLNLYSIQLLDNHNFELCYHAFDWLTFLSEYPEECKLNISKPHIPELFPNLNNTMDYPWATFKRKFAHECADLSLISGLGNKKRDRCYVKGQYTLSKIDIEPFQKNIQLKKLIEGFSKPTQIKYGQMDSKNRKNMYVDIETCYVFELGVEFTVMICCGYYDVNGNWTYNIFSSDGLNDEPFTNFERFSRDFQDFTFVHFSSAEEKIFKKMNERIQTRDLHKEFIELYKRDDININNLCGFSIKEIIRVLFLNKLVEVNPYDTCTIKSGVEVLAIYNNLYEKQFDREYRDALVREVILYNQADVRSLQLLDEFLERVK